MTMQTCKYLPFPSWDYDLKNTGAFHSFHDSSVAVHEIPDLAGLPQSSLDLAGLEWSFPELTSLVSPVSTLEGHNQCTSPAFQAPSPLQSPSGTFSSVDCFWRDEANLNQTALGDALKTNDQLTVSLNKKHEEIRALQERNNQLKVLASQAKHLASILDLLTQSSNSDCPKTNQRKGIKRPRQDDQQTLSAANINDVNRVLHRDSKQPKLHQDVEPVLEERINVYGAFSRLHVNTCSSPADSSRSGEGMCFRTSIRDHCTIRTRVFPQGRTFTSEVHSGGYRFRWVPS